MCCIDLTVVSYITVNSKNSGSITLNSKNIERFSFDLEIITSEQNQNNKRIRKWQFNWFREQTQTRTAFGWFSELQAFSTQ